MTPRPPRWLFVGVAVFIALQQNSWLWNDERLLLGLPVNLLYHLSLSLAVSLFMLILVRRAWPERRDEEEGERS